VKGRTIFQLVFAMSGYQAPGLGEYRPSQQRQS